MNKLLLIDLRTPFHVREFKRIIYNFKFLKKFDFVFLAPKNLSLDSLKGNVEHYSVQATSYKNIFSLLKLVNKVHKYSIPYKSVYLCTAINFGPLHDLLTNRIKIEKGFIFEDGISSYLDMRVKNYWIKKIFYTFFFLKHSKISKKKFFSTDLDLYKNIFTDKYDLAKLVSGSSKIDKLKPITNINLESNLILEEVTYFLSSASIEYGFIKLYDYEKIVKKIMSYVETKNLIVSFHHNEVLIKEKTKIIKKYFNIKKILSPTNPVEKIVFNSNRRVQLIAPYNSTALSACYQSCLSDLILYNDKGPNMIERIELFKKILPCFKFRSKLL